MADPADKTAQIREQLAKPSARALLIVAIGLVMLVPLLLVQGLVGERMQRHDSVTLEIAECPVNTHGLRDARAFSGLIDSRGIPFCSVL